jgi:hypothetical protein
MIEQLSRCNGYAHEQNTQHKLTLQQNPTAKSTSGTPRQKRYTYKTFLRIPKIKVPKPPETTYFGPSPRPNPGQAGAIQNTEEPMQD